MNARLFANVIRTRAQPHVQRAPYLERRRVRRPVRSALAALLDLVLVVVAIAAFGISFALLAQPLVSQ